MPSCLTVTRGQLHMQAITGASLCIINRLLGVIRHVHAIARLLIDKPAHLLMLSHLLCFLWLLRAFVIVSCSNGVNFLLFDFIVFHRM